MNQSTSASNFVSVLLKIFFGSLFLAFILSPAISAVRQDSSQSKVKERAIRAERVATEEEARTKQAEMQRSKDAATKTGVSTTSSVPCNTVLFLGDVTTTRLFAFNYPPFSTITFTTTQTNPGIVGFAATAAGPFIPNHQFPVTMDGAGNGVSTPYYVKGLVLGFTQHYDVSDFPAVVTSVDYNVIPQCNCPPIPVIP
jgi:hypothetical protein